MLFIVRDSMSQIDDVYFHELIKGASVYIEPKEVKPKVKTRINFLRSFFLYIFFLVESRV
jgi:hypothetical protein